jgi:hypothetical protein
LGNIRSIFLRPLAQLLQHSEPVTVGETRREEPRAHAPAVEDIAPAPRSVQSDRPEPSDLIMRVDAFDHVEDARRTADAQI